MSIYDDLRDVVSEVMKEFKQGVIKYVHVTPGDGPVDDPGEPIETAFELDATMRGVKFKYVANGLAVASDLQVNSAVLDNVSTPGIPWEELGIFPNSEWDGAQLWSYDDAYVDDTKELSPNMRGFIEADGIRYKIQHIIFKPSAGAPVAYTFIIRK